MASEARVSEARVILASNLKRLRKIHGYSLHEVEGLTGLTYSYVSAVEQLRANISIDNIQKFADLFSVPAYMLLLPKEDKEEGASPKRASPVRKKATKKKPL